MQYFYDKDRNLVIYPAKVDTGVAEAKQASQDGRDYTIVPASLPNLQQLTRLGLPCIPPMHDYDWPRPDTWRALEVGVPRLIEAEQTTANFIALNPRSFVFNEQRTGKTPASLWAAHWLMQYWRSRGHYFSVLILCTKSNIGVWERHVRLLFGASVTCSVITGTAARRQAKMEAPADFRICNHDGLQVASPDKLPPDVQMCIVDEATAYKHANTDRSTHTYNLIRQLPHITVMSGTPTPEGPINAYGLAKLVGRHGRESYTSFKQRIMYRVSEFRWVYYDHAQTEATALLTPSICYRQADIWPLKTRLPAERRECKLSVEQDRLVKEIRKEMLTTLESGVRIGAVHEGSLRWKLIQIVSGVVYERCTKPHPNKPNDTIEYNVYHSVGAVSRVQMVKDILDECQGRAVIYSGLGGVVEMLAKELKRYKPEIIDGSVPAKRRTHIVQRFNNHEIGPIIGDPSSMAHGLDLARGASTIIWYAPIDKYEIWAQANERIEGVNQTRPTQVYQLYATNFELEMYRRLSAKESVQGSILELVRNEANTRELTGKVA